MQHHIYTPLKQQVKLNVKATSEFPFFFFFDIFAHFMKGCDNFEGHYRLQCVNESNLHTPPITCVKYPLAGLPCASNSLMHNNTVMQYKPYNQLLSQLTHSSGIGIVSICLILWEVASTNCFRE